MKRKGNKIEKLKVGLDFDNVLSNTTYSLINFYNRLTGNHLTMNDLHEWDLAKCVPPEHSELILELLRSPRLWEHIQPLTESQLYCSLLCKEFDVYVVTSTSWETSSMKMSWLHHEYPFIDMSDRVFITPIKGDGKKLVGVDVLVDDHINNLVGGKYKKILLDYTWNRDFEADKHGIYRAHDWLDIYNEVKRIAKAKQDIESLIED